MTQAAVLAQMGNTNQTFRNRIINGAMMIDQRNAGASVTQGTTNQFPVDRWAIFGSVASKFTGQQNAGSVTPPTGYKNYLGITSSSAYTVGSTEFFQLRQTIEGFNVADLGWGAAGAQTITLSFWVRSSLTGAFGGSIGNNAGDRSYPFSYTISSANTWEQKTITIAGDTSGTWLTDNSGGLWLYFGLGVGSTKSGSANTWAAADYRSVTGATSVVGTNGATFYITGVQLEAGTTATPFEMRSYGAELALCQRYFWQTSDSSSQNGFCNVGYFTTTRCFGVGALPVQMRAAPTLTSTAANTFGILTTAGLIPSSLTLYGATTNAFTLDITTGATTAGFAGYLRSATATTATLSFSSEL